MKTSIALKSLIIAYIAFIQHLGAEADEQIIKHLPGSCDGLFSQDKIVVMQYRYSPSEKITRTIDVISSPGRAAGIFIGQDNLGWKYEGRYSRDGFQFTMKSGGNTVSGNAICTKYGAIGVKHYTNKKSEIYRIMWLKFDDLK